MRFTYDLVHEPWLPCLDLQGRRVFLGLQDTLLQAHELRELDGETPLVTASLYRLLLAVLHRVFGPKDLPAWADLWRAGQWEPESIRSYLDRWRERFDLFHPERPFYQTTDTSAIPKMLTSFAPHVSSGNNPTLFNHQRDEAPILYEPSQAARTLITAQAYGIGGLSGIPRVSFTDGPCTHGIVFLLEGNSLFETLALNLIRYPASLSGLETDDSRDKPAWEMASPTQPPRQVPLGYLDYLTWHNRHILLQPEIVDGCTVVGQCLASPALRLSDAIRDPMMLWQASKRRGVRALAFQIERALWRDSSALLGRGNGASPQPIAALIQLEDMPKRTDLSEDDLPMEPCLTAFGLAKSRAKVELTRAERLPVPRAYLQDRDLVDDLARALALAEDAAKQLWGATRTLASYLVTRQLAPDQDRRAVDRQRRQDLDSLQEHWAVDRHYWNALEVPFLETLRAIPDDADAALDAWRAVLRDTARAALWHITRSLEHDPASLKAVVRAERRLGGGLKKVLKADEGSTTAWERKDA